MENSSWRIFDSLTLTEWNISKDLIQRRSSRRSRKTCEIKTMNLKIFPGRIIFMSMFNDFDWTKRGNSENVFQTPNKSRLTRRDSREDTGLSSVLETKRSGAELSATPLKEMGFRRRKNGGTIQRNRWPTVPENQCFQSWNSEKKKEISWTSMQNPQTQKSYFRTVHSANQLRVDFWKVPGKRKWAATEKCEAVRSEFFGANSKEWYSSIWKQIARMSSEIWSIGERNPIYKSLWRCVVLERSLCWDELQKPFLT